MSGTPPVTTGWPMLEPVTLRGARVRLEPLSTDHLPALCEVGLDEELWRLTASQVRDEAEMGRWVEAALDAQRRGTALPFATLDAASGRVIGSTRFGNADRWSRRVEIGWTWVARPWQRTPANTEAKYLMLRHAFEAWVCLRVELKTDVLNTRSRNAMLRIGAREEGTLRKHIVTEGGRVRDTVYFGIVDDDWPAVRARLEEMLARPFAGADRGEGTASAPMPLADRLPGG